MQITREELEAQGIFIPSEVNDELLARFRVGSKILISTYFPEIGLVNLKIQHSYECIKYRELLCTKLSSMSLLYSDELEAN